jgi:hypothetical protein
VRLESSLPTVATVSAARAAAARRKVSDMAGSLRQARHVTRTMDGRAREQL